MKLLLDALEQIKRPGSFCAGGEIESCFPGLEIDKVGAIGLPLSADQARNIIDQCSRAPYGRGENTIVDISVRRTWQLEPSAYSDSLGQKFRPSGHLNSANPATGIRNAPATLLPTGELTHAKPMYPSGVGLIFQSC